MHIIGDVQGKDCIIVADLIDTAGTLTNAGARGDGKERPARRRLRRTRRALWPRLQRIVDSPLEEVVVTNSIPSQPRRRPAARSGATCLSLASSAKAIRRIHNSDSVSSLFV